MGIKLPTALSLGPFSGLRARVVLAIALLTALLVILFGLLVLGIIEHNLLQQKKTQGRVILAAMQASLDVIYMPAQGERAGASQNVPALVRAILNDLDISSLVIVDGQLNVIGHSRPEMIGSTLDEADLTHAMREKKFLYRIVGAPESASEMLFYGPLYRGGSLFGAARFTLPLEDLHQAVGATKRLYLLYAVLDAVLVILIGSTILLRFLVRPIEAMALATERMAAGEYKAPPANLGRGEIGRLNRALNMLASALRDKEAVNRRQLEKLERINTELKEAHNELLHSDRLAYVGRVAAGVAHEVGNPLGVIYGYLEILREANLPEEEAGVLTRLEAEIKRIDQTMRELLDFSRAKPAEVVRLDLLQAARVAANLMKKQRGLDLVDVQVAESESPPVFFDPSLFQQVMLNLLLNAADAMSGRGLIRVTCDAAPYDRAELLEARLPNSPDEAAVPFTDAVRRGIVFSDPIGPAEGTPTVRLHVADSGPGIPADVLVQVFEPFYTTKPRGKGTGLGLSICQRIVSSTGGVIRIESRPGAGTLVTLILPAAPKERANG